MRRLVETSTSSLRGAQQPKRGALSSRVISWNPERLLHDLTRSAGTLLSSKLSASALLSLPATPSLRSTWQAAGIVLFLAGRISVDRKGEVGDGISACSTWCIPRVCFGFLRVSSDITPLNNCFPSYFTLLPPTAHNRSTIFERYVSKVACRLPARNMDSPELQERLRLYSKEIADHTFNQWLLSLHAQQMRPRPEKRPPPEAQLPPWFPPVIPMGAHSSQLML